MEEKTFISQSFKYISIDNSFPLLSFLFRITEITCRKSSFRPSRRHTVYLDKLLQNIAHISSKPEAVRDDRFVSGLQSSLVMI